jgi:glycosyltransferase involved in cell wall biosynthesis
VSSSSPPKVPRFSVVTPSFNQAAFIAETMRSVLSQEGDFEIEYFVMDGGSTDGAVEIIRKFAEEVAAGRWRSRCAGLTMTWVSQKDDGQSDAINQGLRRVSGDFVGYINSDDAYLPGAFMSVAGAFADDPGADFVFGDGDVIGEHGELLWEWISRPYNQKVMTSYNFLWNDFTNYIMQQATFWRRRVHDRIGYFDETLHFVMDAEYWIRAGHAGMRLVHLPRKLARFRLIEGTKSRSSPTVFWEDYLEIFRRYRGAKALSGFFGYYYYNLAKHREFDLDRALEAGQAAFARWTALPLAERKILEDQARVGFGLACALVARTLLEIGRLTDADLALRRSVRQRRGLLTHLAVASYIVNRIVCPSGRRYLKRIEQFLIRQHRRRRSPARHARRLTRSEIKDVEG